ncbi:MAG: TonB family protein [Terriglobales bacterium]|jgi:protein TonB
MGYQALLFCPDEKLARVVSQVFSELDFAVEPVHEPFAAVKKLVAQRFDAIVVDCENEQNASLLFRSAKNSSCNQSSLAIAVVEGQAGVAKAYRMGANLVLTKPINVEQAKGTLRVARGLLRKNSEAANAATPGMPAKTAPESAGGSFPPASRAAATASRPSRPELAELEAPMTATIPEALVAGLPTTTALARVEDNPALVPAPAAQSKTTSAAGPALESRQPESAGTVQNDVAKNDEVKNEAANIAATSLPAQNTSSAFTAAPGSAAAPAPAKKVTAPPAKENKIVEKKIVKSKIVESKIAESESAPPSHDAGPVPLPTSNSVSTTGAPSFAVALDEHDSWGSSGFQKILMVVIAVLALAALGYLGYSELGKSSKTPAPQPVSSPQDSKQPAPTPMSSPVAAPSTSTPGRASAATQTLAPKTATAAPRDEPSAGPGNSTVIRIAANAAANSEPGTKKPDSAPLHVKSGPKMSAQAEESAPPLPSPSTDASANDSSLSGLISSASSNPPRPSLATVKLSQGVSQGLLIKRVQPTYPHAALAAHTQGAVQIEATINKEGNVTNLKVLRGDAALARAALDAVRQWRYKPYYLDGEPVEIQTQITVNFKAN